MPKSKHCKNYNPDISTEDLELFHQTVNDPKSFVVFDKDKATSTYQKKDKFLKYRLITDAIYSASDKLFYNKADAKIIKQMQQGNIIIDADIDLHGQTLEESCISLANFIYYHQSKNYIHIIHGKGYNANNMSKLKTQVAIYLQDHPQISAFCSCPPNAGGTGAVFAKIKN